MESPGDTPAGWPTSLSGRFEPLAQLGRGNFGTVFAAVDRTRDARVAVKVLRADRQHALQAFKREFRALADLAHAHLVPLHELGREGDTWFLVMEAIDGSELLAALRERPERLEPVFAQLALGLAFLHDAGRLHRDLKPSNVRVTPEGRAVLLDFGLAIDGEADEGEGIVGAAAWLSPEQAAGAPATRASDVYALGVMLHEALSGRRPFEGPALEVLAAKRTREAVVELSPAPPRLQELCTRLLARAPERRPTAAEVAAHLDPSLAPFAQRPEAPLVGRGQLLASLAAAAADPQAVAVWLHGAPGLGKSALLRYFLAEQASAGATVLASRCFEHESAPFKAIDGLVDGLVRWLSERSGPPLSEDCRRHVANLARSFPALRGSVEVAASSSPPDLHRREAAVGFREVLSALARERRVVVAIDDLHWADADSIPFLRELLETAGLPALLFVGAQRDEGPPQLEPLRKTPAPMGCARRVDLPVTPLSREDSEALARAMMPERGDLEGLVRVAGGNPFLLQALAGHEGDLQQAVAARLAALPQPARRLVEVLALAGAPLQRPVWTAAAAVAQEDALALAHLRASRLVRVRRDGALEPYHDTLRRAVLDAVPPALRRSHHGLLADALTAAHAEPELLALHLFGAGRRAEAADQAFLGAERAMAALAYNHAAALYADGLSWAPGRDDARARRLALGNALSNAGRGEEAAEALLGATAGAGPSEVLELRTRAAAQLLRSGLLERGLALTREVLEARGLALARTPRGALASMVWTRARLHLRGLDFTPAPEASLPPDALAQVDALMAASIGLAAVDSLRAADLMGQALLRTLKLGEPRRAAICLGYEVAFAGNAGGAGEARTMKVRAAAERAASSIDDTYAKACALGGAGIAAFHLGQLAEARDFCERSLAMFERCPGAIKEIATNQLFTLAAMAQAGDLGALARRLPPLLALARERSDRYFESTLRSGLPNLAWLAADDEPRARAELIAARPGLITASYSVQHFFECLGRFNVELYAGDGDAAARVLAEGMPALQASLMARTEWIAITAAWMQGRSALASSRRSAKSRALVLRHAASIERRQRPWGDALALGLRAGEAQAAGDPARACELLDRAATRSDETQLRAHAESYRFVAARLRSDSQAQARARAAALELGVQRLDSMCRVYAPGFD